MVLEPLVLTINSNYQYNLERKEISNILAKYLLHGHFYSHITKKELYKRVNYDCKYFLVKNNNLTIIF